MTAQKLTYILAACVGLAVLLAISVFIFSGNSKDDAAPKPLARDIDKSDASVAPISDEKAVALDVDARITALKETQENLREEAERREQENLEEFRRLSERQKKEAAEDRAELLKIIKDSINEIKYSGYHNKPSQSEELEDDGLGISEEDLFSSSQPATQRHIALGKSALGAQTSASVMEVSDSVFDTAEKTIRDNTSQFGVGNSGSKKTNDFEPSNSSKKKTQSEKKKTKTIKIPMGSWMEVTPDTRVFCPIGAASPSSSGTATALPAPIHITALGGFKGPNGFTHTLGSVVLYGNCAGRFVNHNRGIAIINIEKMSYWDPISGPQTVDAKGYLIDDRFEQQHIYGAIEPIEKSLIIEQVAAAGLLGYSEAISRSQFTEALGDPSSSALTGSEARVGAGGATSKASELYLNRLQNIISNSVEAVVVEPAIPAKFRTTTILSVEIGIEENNENDEDIKI